jgi:hypothetical protein
MPLSRGVHVIPDSTTRHTGYPRSWIHSHSSHGGKVDEQRTVTDPVSSNAVAAAAHTDGESEALRDFNGAANIVAAGAGDGQGRAAAKRPLMVNLAWS